MRTVYKYPLKIEDVQEIKLPKYFQFLDIQVQNGIPCLYAMVDTKEEFITMQILLFGTGHEIPCYIVNYSYIGTFQLFEGKAVFHAFWSCIKE